MDWRSVLDVILANRELWWFAVSGLLSLLFGFLARWPAAHEILSSVSFDVPRLLNGIRMLFKPGTKPLPQLPPAPPANDQ